MGMAAQIVFHCGVKKVPGVYLPALFEPVGISDRSCCLKRL